MPATPNTNTTTTTAEIDERAWTLRQSGYRWAAIARILGMANESTARTAGNRHAARIGAAHGYVAVPTTGRTTARRPRTARPAATPAPTGRTFGVEIECNGIDRGAAARAINAAGIPAVVEGYNHQTRSYWKVITDASVSGTGLEVVSPILRGEEGLTALRTVMMALRSAGAQVDVTCGMHVHIGSDDLTNEQRARVLETYFQHHDTINRFVAPSRRSADTYVGRRHNYCRVPATHEVSAWAAEFRRGARQIDANRYVTLNVTSYVKYGTIEFRQHQGTLNARKATAWVRFLLGIYEAVQADATAGIPTGLAMLGAMADGGFLPREAATYLMARADTLAPTA